MKIIISESFRRSRVRSCQKTNRSIDAKFNFRQRDEKRSQLPRTNTLIDVFIHFVIEIHVRKKKKKRRNFLIIS